MMSYASLRRATLNDAEAIAHFSARVFFLSCPQTAANDLAEYVAGELNPARWELILGDANQVTLVAEAAGKIVGYIVVALQQEHPALDVKGAAEFRKLYVEAEQHGTGVGAQLFEAALAVAEAHRRPVWLGVFQQNQRAIAFYKKYDFVIAGEQIFQVGKDPQLDYLMLRAAAPLLLPE